jgi:hypothetical protein
MLDDRQLHVLFYERLIPAGEKVQVDPFAVFKLGYLTGLEHVAEDIRQCAFLHGNDKWRERKALNEMAESIQKDIDEAKP